MTDCAICRLPLNAQLVRLGEDTHPSCERHGFGAQYCHPDRCPAYELCCLKAATFRPIRNVPVGDRL